MKNIGLGHLEPGKGYHFPDGYDHLSLRLVFLFISIEFFVGYNKSCKCLSSGYLETFTLFDSIDSFLFL